MYSSNMYIKSKVGADALRHTARTCAAWAAGLRLGWEAVGTSACARLVPLRWLVGRELPVAAVWGGCKEACMTQDHSKRPHHAQ